MPTPVEMPKLGNTVEDCLLSKWIKAKGARVAAGDVIAEIETDKATFEVPAPASGVVLETFFEEGALVPVFTNICAIGEPGEDVAALAPKGPPTAVTKDAEPAVTAAATAPERPRETTGETFVSPRARRFAEQHGLDAHQARGSGPGGRILEQDVREMFYSSPRETPLARRQAADAPPAPSAKPLAGIRQKIAQRLRESLTSTAQYTLNSSADASPMLALRSRIKARRGEMPDINLNDMVLFATVKALLRMPQLNAELKDGKLEPHAQIHLGFACDTDRGLMVPVIRDAHKMDIAELARATKDLAERAVKGAILPDELSGATFTVSNLGSLGIESFTPILNAPQVGILGVDSIEPRMVRRNGKIEIDDRIGLSLTVDHQVIDGAPGARFLGVVRESIEDIERLSGLKV